MEFQNEKADPGSTPSQAKLVLTALGAKPEFEQTAIGMKRWEEHGVPLTKLIAVNLVRVEKQIE